MSKPKKQHYVPQCYLKQFVDPNTPSGQEPYVWVFDKDGRNRRKRAPSNIFTSTDLYTLHVPGRGKDYSIEQNLSQLESEYAKVFDEKIRQRRPLSDYEHVVLCAFTGAMLQRTLRHKDTLERFFDDLIDRTETLERFHGLAPKKSTDLRRQKEDVHKLSLVSTLPGLTTLLQEMSVAFLCVDQSGSKFITSDDPCNLFNPDLQWQSLYGPGLGQERIEVTLPLSPDTAILLSWSNMRGYVEISKARIEDRNRMTRGSSYQYFISHSPKARRFWYSKYPYDPVFITRVFGHKLGLGIRAFSDAVRNLLGR